MNFDGPTSRLVDDAIEQALRGGHPFPIVLLSEGLPNQHGRPPQRPLSIVPPPREPQQPTDAVRDDESGTQRLWRRLVGWWRR